MRQVILLGSLLLTNLLFGTSAMPGPITVTQPDGTTLTVIHKGDEWAGWHETLDGWSIVQDATGTWVYAKGVQGRFLIPSQAVVGQDNPPVADVAGQPLLKHLRPEPFQRPVYNTRWQGSAARTDTFRIPVLLVEFPNYAAVYPDTIFNNIYNQVGYGHPGHPGSGSFRDFYQEISYGQFLPQGDIYDWEVAPEDHDYYAYSNPDGYSHVLELVRAMVDSAEANGMDWSQYDNDGDGYVEALTIIHAGPGAEQGDHSNIWSHRWSLSAAGLQVQYDGVWINDYSINPEIQSGNIVAIGVISHEFGHILGLPDLYDTDYSSSGAGKLALMASGSWGTSGNSPWYPSAMNAWSKTEMGWTNVITLTADQTGIPIEQSYTSNTIYQVNHTTDDSEYWLIENRQKRGTDVLMPSAGLLFWHIDTEKTSGWGVNNDEPHYGVGLEQADGQFDLENGFGSDGGDPYPGTTDNHTFSNSTIPNTHSYYDIPSMIAFENISAADSIMTLDLTFGDYLLEYLTVSSGSGNAYDTGTVDISLDNPHPVTTMQFNIERDPSILSIESVELLGRATADTVLINEDQLLFVNPNIPTGNGPILRVTFFANTSIAQDVVLSFSGIYAADTANAEIGLLGNYNLYHIQAVPQLFTISADSAAPGTGGSYTVNLENSVPLKMIVLTISDTPDYLIPSDELYTDTNGNGNWDTGEPFQDWNNDGSWTPLLQLSDRLAGWNLVTQYDNNALTIMVNNWSQPLEVGSGPLLTVNNLVDSQAPTGPVTINITTAQLMDMYGINGVEYSADYGLFIITESLTTSGPSPLPQTYVLYDNYPNPFNPETTIPYDVPKMSTIRFAIHNILGQVILETVKEVNPGHYTFRWMGQDQHGQSVPTGVYFFRMETLEGSFSATRKLVLLK